MHLLILNQDRLSQNSVALYWNQSILRVCADGGANALYHCFNNDEERLAYLPNKIIGDLDSLSSPVRQFYSSHKVEIIKIEEQDSTDFQKCIQECPSDEWVVLGGLDGRFDHTMSCLHTLLVNKHISITLVSHYSYCRCLSTGSHNLDFDRVLYGDSIGLFPLTGTALCTTTGLKWNIDHSMPLQFGMMISTSNTFDNAFYNSSTNSNRVGISTDTPLILTVSRSA